MKEILQDGHYSRNNPSESSIITEPALEGETIEMKVRRIMELKEPITDGAPLVYTERKEGVLPETNIRSDRFDMALEMTNQITANSVLKRQEAVMKVVKDQEPPTE